MGTMKRKFVLVLAGVHGAGKTTIGSALGLKHQIAFYGEIGWQLRRRVDFAVTEASEAFDREVMRLELDRDRVIQQCQSIPVVETWHLGNIAFCLSRGSCKVADSYMHAFEMALNRFDPYVCLITIDDDTFLQRVSERQVAPQEALGFYRTVEDNILEVAHKLELSFMTLDGTMRPEAAAEYLAGFIRENEGQHAF